MGDNVAWEDGRMSNRIHYSIATKMVEDAGLIDNNDGWLDVHYRKIAHLLLEIKQLREENKKLKEEEKE